MENSERQTKKLLVDWSVVAFVFRVHVNNRDLSFMKKPCLYLGEEDIRTTSRKVPKYLDFSDFLFSIKGYSWPKKTLLCAY